MDDTLETIELENNLTLKIYPDDTPIDPREDAENQAFGSLICFHRRYTLGERHTFASEIKPSGEDTYEDSPDGLTEYMKDQSAIKLPVFLLDHSGLRMNVGGFNHLGYIGHFDSGQVGYIFVSKEKALKELGGKYLVKSLVQKAIEIMKSEISEYDAYLAGACYGYQVVCDICEEVIDSCWGYTGWDAVEYIKNEVKESGVCCEDCNQTSERLDQIKEG